MRGNGQKQGNSQDTRGREGEAASGKLKEEAEKQRARGQSGNSGGRKKAREEGTYQERCRFALRGQLTTPDMAAARRVAIRKSVAGRVNNFN